MTMRIGTETLDLLGTACLGAGPDRDHRDQRGDADDDAEHRERAPQTVRAKRPGRAPCVLEDHAAPSLARLRATSTR